jgi:hypothetical protein
MSYMRTVESSIWPYPIAVCSTFVGLVSAWGASYLCWPVLARLLPGELNPLRFVGGADGVQRLDFWWVVGTLVGEPVLLVSMDVTLPAEVILRFYAVRLAMELSLRDLKQYGGLGDYQCDTLLAMHRFVHLALTAFYAGGSPCSGVDRDHGARRSAPRRQASRTRSAFSRPTGGWRQVLQRIDASSALARPLRKPRAASSSSAELPRDIRIASRSPAQQAEPVSAKVWWLTV